MGVRDFVIRGARAVVNMIFSEKLLGSSRKTKLLEFISGKCLKEIYDALPSHGKQIFLASINAAIHLNNQNPVTITQPDSEPDGSDPFPLQIRKFETLYDSESGNWYAPAPIVRINVFDKRLYTEPVADCIELETGHLYFELVRLIEPRLILETGVSRGYSTCCLAAGLKSIGGDRLVYAIDPAMYPHLWEGTHLEPFIVWMPKLSLDVLPDVRHFEFDLLVIDSHHDYETCHWEISNFEKILKPGGYILMHDSLHYDGVGAVVKQLMANPRFEVVTLPTPRGKSTLDIWPRRSGLTIVRKKKNGPPEIEYDERFKGWFWGDTTQLPYLWRTE